MSRPSDKFEQQIYRIHKLLNATDAEIVWNDRIPDPDNSEQARQIDISIRKDDKLTLVECRIHQKKQDVKWIEELIGRRISLRADAIIAVSASGFTRNAIIKSQKYGVILRDIMSLTEQEISTWGYKTSLWLTYYKYSNIGFEFIFSKNALGRVTLDHIEALVTNKPEILHEIFSQIASQLNEENFNNKKVAVKATMNINNISIVGYSPQNIKFSANVEEIKNYLNIPSVVVYDEPGISALERNTFIEAVELGEFEITQSNNEVSVALDFTAISIPQNCQFQFVTFDFKRPVIMKNVQRLGLPDTFIPVEEFTLSLNYA